MGDTYGRLVFAKTNPVDMAENVSEDITQQRAFDIDVGLLGFVVIVYAASARANSQSVHVLE